MKFLHSVARLVVACATGAATTAALADRPMVVDDASVGDVGNGNLKLWYTDADGKGVTSAAAAYTIWKSVELEAQLARGSGLRGVGVQAKWQITPEREHGCHVGASLGWTRVELDRAGRSNASGITALATCNDPGLGTAHFNLGWARPSGGPGATNWGVAVERSFGAVTPNIEVFGADDTNTTVQIGLRGPLAPGWQLDGSIGRSAGVNIYTVGLRLEF